MRPVLLALIVALTGCPQFKPGTDIIPIDSGEEMLAKDAEISDDAGEDVSPDAEAEGGRDASDTGPDASDIGPLTANPGLTTSGGGGTVSSEGYRLRLIVSPPTPVGTTQSDSYRLFLGAGPAQHQQ